MSPVLNSSGVGLLGADDSTLVDLARNGSSEAFCQLDVRYRTNIRRYCSGLVGEDASEDVAQQALANAFGAMKDTDSELDFKPWLFRIAHNTAVDYLRRAPPDHEQIPGDFDGVMQPPQKVAQTERLHELVQNIAGLPNRQRTALVLSELEGRSHAEVALRIQTGQRTVKDLIYHARNSLRGKLSAFLPFSWLVRQAQLVGTAVPGGGGEMAANIKVVAVAVLAAGGISAAVELGNTERGALGKANVRPDLVDQSNAFNLAGGAFVAMLPIRPGKDESPATHSGRSHSGGDMSASPNVEDGDNGSARLVASVPKSGIADGSKDQRTGDGQGSDSSSSKPARTGKSAAVAGGTGSLDGSSRGGGDDPAGTGDNNTGNPVPVTDDDINGDDDDEDDDEDDDDIDEDDDDIDEDDEDDEDD